MTEESITTTEEQRASSQKLYAFVVEQIKAGADKTTISQKLIAMGMDAKDASELVNKMYDSIIEAAEKEQFTMISIIPAFMGGVLAALVCGVIWGVIVITSEYEIGYMAWGVGVAAGYCVTLFSRGKRGLPLQIIAVTASLLGILIGKYLIFYHYLKEMVLEEHGAEAAANVPVLSLGVIQFFFENIVSLSHPMDLLWIFLAVATAWRMLKGSGIRVVAGHYTPTNPNDIQLNLPSDPSPNE